MSFTCGIIGLPNVGKSTLFNLLTNSNVKNFNFPFCTIKPNVGITSVPDIRILQLSEIVRIKKIVPATIEFVDVAGLVKGASKGEGLGNRFLSDISNTSVLIHVIRCFDSKVITHIYNSISPKRDVEIINLELILYDLKICNNFLKLNFRKMSIDKNRILFKKKLIIRCIEHLEKMKSLRTLLMSHEEQEIIKTFKFLTIKPVIYVANIGHDENKLKSNNLKEILQINDSGYFKIIEISLNKKLISTQNSNLENIIKSSCKFLNLILFFTIGKREIRSWAIKSGSIAIQAAKKVHSDFKKGFIKAKIISFNNFLKYKNELNAKKFGKLRYEGRNYIIKDGDIVEFLFNN